MSSIITLTGSCPVCGHALKLCQAKACAYFIGCTAYPRCTFKAPYDPVLQELYDQNARLRAEVTLLQMQRTPASPTDLQRGRTTWAKVVQERRTALPTWADVAHKWGTTLCERKVR